MSPLSLSDILNSGLAITTNCMSFKTQMKPQVSVKVSFKFETLSTMMAGEWLLSRVNSHVSLKVYFNGETLSTLFTGERFLSSVDSNVILKGIVHFEIKIWYLSAYPKGIQDVGVFFFSRSSFDVFRSNRSSLSVI